MPKNRKRRFSSQKTECDSSFLLLLFLCVLLCVCVGNVRGNVTLWKTWKVPSHLSLSARYTQDIMRFPWAKPPPPPPPPPTSFPAPPVLGAVAAVVAVVVFVLRRNGAASMHVKQSKPKSHPGVVLGSISMFMMVSANAVTFPFMQARRDALQCDALCQGGQTSLRSGLSLIGAALIGRASDRFGRVPMLYLGTAGSLIALGINGGMDTLLGMWIAIVPVSLLNQNFSVAKALFSDYISEQGGTDADRAGAVGKLGMAVGLSFMFGPLIATQLVTEYLQAIYLSAAGLVLSGALLLVLPAPSTKSSTADGAKSNAGSGLMDFINMPVLRTRGAQLIMALRLLMALAFHMFAPVWQVSIRERFAFGPKDHAQFMGVIGLTYALSQGVFAKPLIKRAGADPSRLLMVCMLFLGGARPFALWTRHIEVVYALYVPMVISLGVLNTAITTACSGLAEGDQLGGLFGVLESVESTAGIVGPTLGGLLRTTWGTNGALAAVAACYIMAFMLVALFFQKHVSAVSARAKKTA